MTESHVDPKIFAIGGKEMSKSHLTRTMVVYVVIFLLGALLAPVLSRLNLAAVLAGNRTAQAHTDDSQAVPADVLGPDAPDLSVYACNPDFVGEFIKRVHVHCTVAAPGGVYWFATPTSDSKLAARVFSLMLTAAAAGKYVRVYYDNAASGASYGCLVADCRPITYIELVN